MDRRKELINQYKERKLYGGVYKVTNERNGKYFLSHAIDIRAVQNRHNFSATTGLCVYPDLQEDWREFGGKAFVFEVLETIEMKEGQSRGEFEGDLTTLEQLWRERLDASKAC
ncbi:MAG: GIY-YIG nuclease family protein [Chloroflexi bacterium]|nr:GIY-YIG nuclease family protein [Chloroflexota bacterium]